MTGNNDENRQNTSIQSSVDLGKETVIQPQIIKMYHLKQTKKDICE